MKRTKSRMRIKIRTMMRAAFTSLLIFWLIVSPAFGWSLSGHKIIASIAFRQLTMAEQSRVVTTLKRHPRFTEEDLLALPVPDKLLVAQREIDKLVNQSIAARREAAQLLEQAKRTVEDLIAGGGVAAHARDAHEVSCELDHLVGVDPGEDLGAGGHSGAGTTPAGRTGSPRRDESRGALRP